MNVENVATGLSGIALLICFALVVLLGIYWILFPMIIAGRLKKIHASLEQVIPAAQQNQKPIIDAINRLIEELRLVRNAANETATCARVGNQMATRSNELLEWVGTAVQQSGGSLDSAPATQAQIEEPAEV